ncbi:unnamed protein product [Malus baccata var. baccata]
MITRAKAGIHKPKVFTATKHYLPAFIDSLTCLPPTPTTFLQASKNSNWMAAMKEEFQALQSIGTWDLVPFHPSLNLVGCKWVFRVKHRLDGSIKQYKARLVAKGFHQQERLDFFETFSPIAKPTMIQILLSIVVSYDWFVHQLDVNNAFLHGTLKDDPPDFVDSTKPQHVCKLNKSLSSLKQASRAWYETFYKNLSDIHYFLGIEVHRSAKGLFLNQSKYALDLLKKTYMIGVKPCSTSVGFAKLDHSGIILSYPTFYRLTVGALQYLTWIRPYLAFVVNQGTIDAGLWFTKGSQCLTTWSNVDWAGCPMDRRSTSGYFVFLGPNLISWTAKKQCTIARSFTEVEYRSFANTAAKLSWDISFPILKTFAIFCDNKSAIALTFNLVFHARTKYVEIGYHYIRDKVLCGKVSVHHVAYPLQLADIFTKSLSSDRFAKLTSKLSVRSPNFSLRGCVKDIIGPSNENVPD